jgi:hypothetical protein
MDLVPHIPHLHGLDIQFLKIHIDREPSLDASVISDNPTMNGHGHDPISSEILADSLTPHELTNGH